MLNQETETQALYVNKKNLEKAVSFGKALERLEKNKDFKKVITEGFLRDWAVDTAQRRGHPQIRSNALLLDNNTRSLDAIGELNWFLSQRKTVAEDAQAALNEVNEEIVADGLAE